MNEGQKSIVKKLKSMRNLDAVEFLWNHDLEFRCRCEDLARECGTKMMDRIEANAKGMPRGEAPPAEPPEAGSALASPTCSAPNYDNLSEAALIAGQLKLIHFIHLHGLANDLEDYLGKV